MVKAFVFGKFLPFHKGHEAMIRFALTKCDKLSVLICVSDQEKIMGAVRKEWIRKTFSEEENISIEILNYLESELPNTSESSQAVSQIWSKIFLEKFPGHSIVVTSEPYGNYVANCMGIQHIPFDPPRNQVPVSATKVRNHLFDYWHFLPDAVKSFFAIKVVLLGTESTGKSTLTRQLALHYDATAVEEAGRDLVPDSSDFKFDTLLLVANEHACRIDAATTGSAPLLLIDTDIHITISYAEFCFQKILQVSGAIYASNRADLYLYLNNDVPHIQDGTRMSRSERNLLDRSHRKILKDHHINYVEIKGTYDQRFQKAIEAIDKLLRHHQRKIAEIVSPRPE